MPDKVTRQIERAGLPLSGDEPFVPKMVVSRRGRKEIEKATVNHGPKQGKRGYVDVHGRIWIRDRAHADKPDHWDVQIDDGKDYFRVDNEGNRI